LKQLILTFLVVLPAGAYAAEVFRSVDESGLVVYSDRPVTGQDEIISVTGRAPSPVARPAAAGGDAANQGDAASQEGAASPGSLVAEIPQERTPEELAQVRARECARAREQQTNYSAAHRLYRVLENGEREYLTSEEIDATRLKAEADVAAWCD
jgi:Domain of unknown function (DUF4124)